MNTKKFLVAGLIASVTVGASSASVCSDGGWYGQVAFGVSFSKAKYKNDANTKDVLDFKDANIATYTDSGNNNMVYYKKSDLENLKKDVDAASLSKRKTGLAGELGIGYKFRVGDMMIGVSVNLGKNFGKIKKTEQGLSVAAYSTVDKLPDGTAANQIQNANFTPAVDPVGSVMVIKTDTDAALSVKYDSSKKVDVKMTNKVYLSVMPAVEYLVTPEIGIFATAGAKITSDKMTVKSEDGVVDLSKSKTKVVPQAGAGINYNITPEVFTQLSYTYGWKTKISKKADDGVTHKMDRDDHAIRLAVGYLF